MLEESRKRAWRASCCLYPQYGNGGTRSEARSYGASPRRRGWVDARLAGGPAAAPDRGSVPGAASAGTPIEAPAPFLALQQGE
jgi:hypothetical protein